MFIIVIRHKRFFIMFYCQKYSVFYFRRHVCVEFYLTNSDVSFNCDYAVKITKVFSVFHSIDLCKMYVHRRLLYSLNINDYNIYNCRSN